MSRTETSLADAYASANSIANSAATPAEVSLKQRVLKGISWEVGGQFGMHAWRLVSNLVLTRLLAPDAFGVIGLAQVFVMFLTLLSDVGLKGSVIHHERGDEKEFLDTVWTVGVIRGFVMWLVICAGSAGFASFYDMPELRWVLPLIGFSAVIRGFSSTSVLTASREMKNSWYVTVDCGSQVIGTAMTVLIALFYRSVVALALGWLVTASAYVVLSYWRSDIRFNRFHWDRDAVRSLSRFGRWAMASSGFTLMQQRGDRLALGKIVTSGDLGTYVIGANLAILPMTVFWRINSGVAQPMYSRIRHLPVEEARQKIRRLRVGIVCALLPLLALMSIFGQFLVNLLYESQYAMAGWYCSLAALSAMTRVATDLGPIFPAHGDSKTHFKIMGVRTLALVVAMIGGYYIGQAYGHVANGVLYGIVLAPVLSYPYQAWMYRRLNAWLPEVDIVALLFTAVLMAGPLFGWF